MPNQDSVKGPLKLAKCILLYSQRPTLEGQGVQTWLKKVVIVGLSIKRSRSTLVEKSALQANCLNFNGAD